MNKEMTVMGPIPKMLSLVLLVGCLDTTVAIAGEQACNGPYKGRTLTPEELAPVLHNHQAWLASDRTQDDERRANLCQATLQGADLSRADLQGATLQGADFYGADLQGATLSRANLQGAKHGHDVLYLCAE
jgi:Pentapeptide repeats (8 copies)